VKNDLIMYMYIVVCALLVPQCVQGSDYVYVYMYCMHACTYAQFNNMEKVSVQMTRQIACTLCTHVHAHTYIYMRSRRTYTHTHTHTCTRIIHTHTQTHTVLPCMYIHAHAHTQIGTHTTHAHIYIKTQTYTHTVQGHVRGHHKRRPEDLHIQNQASFRYTLISLLIYSFMRRKGVHVCERRREKYGYIAANDHFGLYIHTKHICFLYG